MSAKWRSAAVLGIMALAAWTLISDDRDSILDDANGRTALSLVVGVGTAVMLLALTAITNAATRRSRRR